MSVLEGCWYVTGNPSLACTSQLDGHPLQVAQWRGAAQRSDVALAEAAAQLHAREARLLAASTESQVRQTVCLHGRPAARPDLRPALVPGWPALQPRCPVQGVTERLRHEAEAQRRRCSELAAQLAEAQRAAAKQQVRMPALARLTGGVL